MILTGEYAPGARLPQRRLAKHLGVAQSVLRESLLELRSVGLVAIRGGLGVFVCDHGTWWDLAVDRRRGGWGRREARAINDDRDRGKARAGVGTEEQVRCWTKRKGETTCVK